MEERTALRVLFWFTVSYLLLFTIIAAVRANYEFLYYTAVMSVLIFIIVMYEREIHLPITLMIALTTLGIMHILGGNLSVAGTRLYDLWLIPGFFRYDNLVHTIGTAIATLVAYNLLAPHLERFVKHRGLMSLILVTLALGIGSLNEILEFGAVVFLGAAANVGDYFNNALDQVFNLLGSIFTCLIIMRHHRKHHAKKK